MLRFKHALALVPLVVASACVDTVEVDTATNPIDPSDLDDSAPAPAAHDGSLDYTDRHGFTRNNSTRLYRFDIAAYRDDAERAAHERLYPSHAEALGAHPGAIPSVQTVGTYLKQLDDTIYAGVEHAVQDGLAPTITPKREVLTAAIGYLTLHRSPESDDAMAYLGAALELGGGTAAVPSEVTPKVAARKNEFLANPSVSKPFGFYTWSNELKAIWQQDRLLQQPLAPGSACAIANALGSDAKISEKYQSLTRLYARLTNPLRPSVVHLMPADASCSEKAAKSPHAFLAASSTPEVSLFEELYPTGIPANVDLMDDLVSAIREGRLSLRPTAETGWYGHQLFALETLLVTDKSEERRKVAFTAKYKKRLKEAFQTMLVQHRETHAKQADVAQPTAVAIPDVPDFRVEPLATVYVRHARTYVFLEQALDPILGDGWLDRAKPFGENGAESETLRARIRRARDLFYGLYLTASQDIGLKPTLDQVGDPGQANWAGLASAADKWLLGLAEDPIAKRDVRVMVPIASLDGDRAKYWAVIGVRATLAAYSYLEPHV